METILKIAPSALLNDTSDEYSKLLHCFAQFILRYVMCIVNKESFLAELKVQQADAYNENPDLDKMNRFKCALCIFTSVDVATCWFQYVNHYEEWIAKASSIVAQSKKETYACNSKFTNSKGGRKQGGSAVSDDGVKLYKNVVKFVNDLKSDCNYTVLQRIINIKCKDYGLLENIRPPPLPEMIDGIVDSVDDSNVEKDSGKNVPVFDGWDSLECSNSEGV